MPDVIVTFYDNFHFDEVDISGVNLPGGFKNGSENRTGRFFYSPGPPGFGKEEKKPVVCLYTAVKIQVVASGGTWRLKIHLGGRDYESAPLSATASAAAIVAAFPTEPFPITDPIEPNFAQANLEATAFSGEEDWISVIDLGSGEWELRLFEDNGIKGPSGASVQGIDIDLGTVIQMVPDWDEFQYIVPLEEGCAGVDIPAGNIVVGGPRPGLRHKPGRVVGRRT